jgi:surfactin synthase thioesterase subunit
MTTPANTESPWVRRFHSHQDTAASLVCLPHAGGSASFYVPMSASLAPAVGVLAIQYPGRQDRRTEPAITDLRELAARIHAALRPLPEQPVALFGHSMGATIAFELARLLERDGATVSRLFVSGRCAPSRHRDESIHRRSDAGLVAELRRLAGTDSQFLDDEDMLAMILPALRSDYQALETYRYRPGPMLACPISVFVGDCDPRVTVDEARVWQEHTEAEFDLTVFAGGHFYLSENWSAIVDAVTDRLGTALPL